VILVTGATGFVGSRLLPKIGEIGEPVRCFVRETSNISVIDTNKFQLAFGSFEDRLSFRRALANVDTLINIASLGFGHAPVIVSEAERAGVKRAIFISTTAIFTTLNARSKAIRLEAERMIERSSLNYTILRPTMIYGTERDRNMSRLIQYLSRCPIIPIAGSGESLQRPIHVDDLVDAILSVLNQSNTIRKSYNLSGKDPLSFNEIIDQTASALSKKVVKIHLPFSLVLGAARIYGKLVKSPFITAEQIARLNEDKSFDHSMAQADFGFAPRTFSEGISQQVARMKRLGIIK
jgi:nucleoside-diphosphate-sugar epimerase